MISAAASVVPSIRPAANTQVPRTVTRNIGNRLWISSDEISINRLVKPRAD